MKWAESARKAYERKYQVPDADFKFKFDGSNYTGDDQWLDLKGT